MKKLNHLILTLAILLLSSCGTEFRLVSYAQSNRVSASDVSTSFGPSLVAQRGQTSFTIITPPSIYLQDVSRMQWCTVHGWHNLNRWNSFYQNSICYSGWDSSWRLGPFYTHRPGWNYFYTPYQGWPYWNNNVYSSPYWNRTNRVYINGRRGSSFSNRIQINRPSLNTTTRRSINLPRNNETIISPRTNRNNNTRVRVYQRPENTSTPIRYNRTRTSPSTTRSSTIRTSPTRTTTTTRSNNRGGRR